MSSLEKQKKVLTPTYVEDRARHDTNITQNNSPPISNFGNPSDRMTQIVAAAVVVLFAFLVHYYLLNLKQATLISQLVELQSQMDKFKVKYKTHIAKDFVPLEKRVGDLEQSVNQDSEVSNQENLSLKEKGEEQQKALMLTKNELHDMYRGLKNELHDMYRPFQTMQEKLESTNQLVTTIIGKPKSDKGWGAKLWSMLPGSHNSMISPEGGSLLNQIENLLESSKQQRIEILDLKDAKTSHGKQISQLQRKKTEHANELKNHANQIHGHGLDLKALRLDFDRISDKTEGSTSILNKVGNWLSGSAGKTEPNEPGIENGPEQLEADMKKLKDRTDRLEETLNAKQQETQKNTSKVGNTGNDNRRNLQSQPTSRTSRRTQPTRNPSPIQLSTLRNIPPGNSGRRFGSGKAASQGWNEEMCEKKCKGVMDRISNNKQICRCKNGIVHIFDPKYRN